MKLILLIALAGLTGTLLRYGCSRVCDSLLPGFPWSTLCINVTGSFLAGFFSLFCRAKFPEWQAYYPVLFAGFFGAFTTFSTFALECSRFLLAGHYAKFAFNVTAQNLAGLAAACGGLCLARSLYKCNIV